MAVLCAGLVFAAAAAAMLGTHASRAAASPPRSSPDATTVLAYYYIWFDPSSWKRGKTDSPLLGRYSSDEREVMRRHIRWAKAAGIDGFVVSWKSTERLNRRLEKLIQVADQEHFKLAVIYQGLDFKRNPLPAARVAADIDYFRENYARRRVFKVFSKPLLIWSGTWKFSPAEVASVTSSRRDDLFLLASERNLPGYERLRGLVDGNAYYWSSVDPETYPGYEVKLRRMASTVHSGGGLWIAPASPGFNATRLGHETVVDRKNGATLRRQLDAALGSSPDAVGLISWNEFSENSHIEPSEEFRGRYLDVLADSLGAKYHFRGDFDSSEPAATGARHALPLLAALLALVLGGLAVLRRRGRTNAPGSHGVPPWGLVDPPGPGEEDGSTEGHQNGSSRGHGPYEGTTPSRRGHESD